MEKYSLTLLIDVAGLKKNSKHINVQKFVLHWPLATNYSYAHLV